MNLDPPRTGEGDHAKYGGGGPPWPRTTPSITPLCDAVPLPVPGRITLAIVDLGYGNIGSIAIAFERFGLTPRITSDPQALASASHVILPGVGAAGFAMRRIEALGLAEPLRGLTRPLLGICLGMQLLFDASEEDDTPALGIIPGRVRELTPASDRPVPHMGWSRLSVRSDGTGLRDGDYVYFAHGFACDDGPATIAAAEYGRSIPAVVRHSNFTGTQFHPERSGAAGARFLKAFLDQ